MQSSNKKLKIIIGIIIAVVIIALITGIVLYFTTDIFKSKKDMFNTYLLQDFNTINNIVDLSKETEYRKTLENNNFDENSTVELKYKDIDGNEDVFNATIEGINNNSENKAYKDIKITSKDTNVMEMKYLKENEIYGLHFMDIAEKFATIDTSSNVNPIFEYFGLGDIISSDSIKPINLSELFDLSEDEKSQILNEYL